jgi:hypothetical protein
MGIGAFVRVVGILSLAIFASQAMAVAADAVPECPASGMNLPVNNDTLLQWKRSLPNQTLRRGHVHGSIVQIFPDRNGHDHFMIQIGPNTDDTIEVIYNQDFGSVPDPQVGDNVEACGDFIVSTAQSGPYPPSPAGAIIHWIHRNPKGHGHESGFLMINGTLYGQDAEHAGPKRGNGRGGNGGGGSEEAFELPMAAGF